MQIFGKDCGRKLIWILEDNIGSKFYPKQIFFAGNFGEQVLEEKVKNIGEDFASKISFWEEKNTGGQKCFRDEIWGAKAFRRKFLEPKIFGGKIWQAKFKSKIFYRIEQTRFSY